MDEHFKNGFKNTFKFCNDIKKFFLLLFCPYEFMDDLEKFDKHFLPEKEKSSKYGKYYRFRLQSCKRNL